MSTRVAPERSSQTMKRVDLLDYEGLFMYIDGVTTVTFFDGTVPLEQLKDRLVQIVQASPWLAGKLVKGLSTRKTEDANEKKEKPKKVYQMCFDPQPSREFILENLLFQIELDIFDKTMSSETLLESIAKRSNAHVKETGFDLLKKKLHYTKLTVVTSPGDDKEKSWALVWSISHTIADGFTYYETLGMFSSTTEVTTLHPERQHNFEENLKKAVSPQVYNTYLGAPGLLMNYGGNILFGGKSKIKAYYVDLEKVEDEKKNIGAGVDFVSTNDILSAWWGKLTNARLVEMAVNFRGRMEGVENNLAGNYEGCILFSNKDFAEGPGSIRKALTRKDGKFQSMNFDPEKKGLPGFWELCGCKYRVITNWASFFSELALEGCTQRLHMPYMALSLIPTDFCIIFRPTKDTLGVFIITRKLKDERLDEDSLLGHKVLPRESQIYV